MTYTPALDYRAWIKERRKNPLLCAGCSKPLGVCAKPGQRSGQASRVGLTSNIDGKKSVLHVHYRDQDCLTKALRKMQETADVAAS